jgi:hypothetical protein
MYHHIDCIFAEYLIYLYLLVKRKTISLERTGQTDVKLCQKIQLLETSSDLTFNTSRKSALQRPPSEHEAKVITSRPTNLGEQTYT